MVSIPPILTTVGVGQLFVVTNGVEGFVLAIWKVRVCPLPSVNVDVGFKNEITVPRFALTSKIATEPPVPKRTTVPPALRVPSDRTVTVPPPPP